MSEALERSQKNGAGLAMNINMTFPQNALFSAGLGLEEEHNGSPNQAVLKPSPQSLSDTNPNEITESPVAKEAAPLMKNAELRNSQKVATTGRSTRTPIKNDTPDVSNSVPRKNESRPGILKSSSYQYLASALPKNLRTASSSSLARSSNQSKKQAEELKNRLHNSSRGFPLKMNFKSRPSLQSIYQSKNEHRIPRSKTFTLSDRVLENPRSSKSKTKTFADKPRYANSPQSKGSNVLNDSEIQSLILQLEDLRKLGYCSSENGELISYDDVVASINRSAESSISIDEERQSQAQILCEEQQNFTAQAHDWIEESNARHQHILDQEVRIAKMTKSLIEMYRPKALLSMYEILEEIERLGLDDVEGVC